MIDCPIHSKSMEWLPHTNEGEPWEFYCVACNKRYYYDYAFLPCMPSNPPMDKREPGRPFYTEEQRAADFTPRHRGEAPAMTPGAWQAKQQGCTCSRLDNQWGWGSVYQTDGGETEFIVDPSCPLHNPKGDSNETPASEGQ